MPFRRVRWHEFNWLPAIYRKQRMILGEPSGKKTFVCFAWLYWGWVTVVEEDK